MIYNLPRKQQKQQVTITSNGGFYLNNVYQQKGTYTAQVGDTIEVRINQGGVSANQLFSAFVSFNGETVKQTGIVQYQVYVKYSFNISNNCQNIQLTYSHKINTLSNNRPVYVFQCDITTT